MRYRVPSYELQSRYLNTNVSTFEVSKAEGLNCHIPLPVLSWYHTWFSFTMCNVPRRPLGETLTCPSALRGADATQNSCCASIHLTKLGGIES